VNRFRKAIRTRSASAFPTRCRRLFCDRPAARLGSAPRARCLRDACDYQPHVIAGETRGPAAITGDYIAHIGRLAVKDIGYEQTGFHWDKASIEVLLHAQSRDIAQGVDSIGNKDEGDGDQGIMFGLPAARRGTDAGADFLCAHPKSDVESASLRGNPRA
jgi:S-adenosylmethionine synthetase